MRALRWFKRLGVRQKAMLIIGLLLILGGFGYLAITGKLGIRAISTTKTVIVKGRSVDPSTGQPIVGATISLWTQNMRPQPSPVPSPRISPTPTRSATPRLSPTPTPIRGGSPTPTPSPTPRPSASIGLLGTAAPSPSPQPSVKTVTDANGNYQAKIVVDTADPAQNMIWVWQYKKDLPNLAPGSQVALQVPQTNLPTVTLTQNFNIGRPPDWASTTGSPSSLSSQEITPLTVTSECQGKYGENINGVIFCSDLNDSNLFSHYRKSLIEIANQISFLRSETGLQNRPKSIFLSRKLDWIPPQEITDNPIVVLPDFGKIYIDEKFLKPDPNDPEAYFGSINMLVNVQFGFIVDWERGWQIPSSNPGRPGCLQGGNLLESHCFSSADKGFLSAYQIAYTSGATNYKLTSPQDFFALYFTQLFEKDSADESYFLNREQLIYETKNFMLMKSGSTQAHNALMFLYKHIANKSQQEEVFPGTIAAPDTYGYDDIANGKYMSVGVVSLRVLDHAGKPMEDTKVAIGTKTVTTRLKKESGVFPDGSGDLFDITGTAVMLDAGTGTTPIDISNPPSYYQGAVFTPVSDEIVQGSNFVIQLSYRQIITRVMVPPPSLVNTCGAYPELDSGCWKGGLFSANFTVFPGRTAQGIPQGQMSRYPNLGTPGGLSSENPPNPIVVILGGGDYGLGSVTRVFERTSGKYPKAKILFSKPANLLSGSTFTVFGRPYQKCTDYTPPNAQACVKY